MDFGALLHIAKKNSETSKNENKYYSTKFAPPKKETKEKRLSNNIQKFLQKREQEEKERQLEEKRKLANLLAKRDEKAKNKIRKMLKVTKSANKSVLDDAINSEHTAITMEGPEQPDQDDYGYVSTEANALYQKYIEKVKDVKEEKGFAPSRPQSVKDLSGTKERVKAAITREKEEKKSHSRQRISTITTAVSSSVGISNSSSASKTLYDPEAERREEERKKREEEQKKAKNRKPPPPPMDFQSLLKLAEKKQHEPIEIIPEVKKKEPERLLTLKEKRELEERQKAKEARERRNRERERNEAGGSSSSNSAPSSKERKENGVSRMEPNGRIPKLGQPTKSAPIKTPPSTIPNQKSSAGSSGSVKAFSNSNHSGSVNGTKKADPGPSSSLMKSKTPQTSTSSTSSAVKAAAPNKLTSSSISKSTVNASALSSANKNPYSSSGNKNGQSGSTREFPPRDMKMAKARQYPPTPTDGQKTRQFPPNDNYKGSQGRMSESRKPQAPKRRIIDDDEEYDSEMDDFIDDGDCEDDYSTHIREIFGYDKSRYRDLDDDDDGVMESNFAQVQREEFLSKKIGLQEDLEDMKMEAMEKKRKMMNKKRKLHG